MTSTRDIVQKLWNLCHVLRDDGITYEKKSRAGQYFTPRPLIDCMVALVKPEPGERVQDSAAVHGAEDAESSRLIARSIFL